MVIVDLFQGQNVVMKHGLIILNPNQSHIFQFDSHLPIPKVSYVFQLEIAQEFCNSVSIGNT